VVLHRLAGKQVLDTLGVGQECKLVLKKRFISVETADGTYIGALPEDISFRLSKLIETGNLYSCRIHTLCNSECTVFLKELNRSKKNLDHHSFPPNKSAMMHNPEMDDRYLFDDEAGLLNAQEVDGDELADKPFEEEEDLERSVNVE
jgi:hypothetical protein